MKKLIESYVISWCWRILMRMIPDNAPGKPMMLWGFLCYCDSQIGQDVRFLPPEMRKKVMDSRAYMSRTEANHAKIYERRGY